MMTRTDLEQMSTGRNGKNEKGFTLLEVMIAVCVLGVGLLAIASMQLGAVNANAKASGVSEASALAEFQMETLMSLPYRFNLANDNQNPTDLQDTNGDGAAGLLFPFPDATPIFDPANLAGWIVANPPDIQRTITRNKRDYTIFWNVATDAEIEDTKTVHITVGWDDGDIGRKITMRRVIPRIS
jgi:prepilin-type N-terminal cleavage/methylation domain-containing protein